MRGLFCSVVLMLCACADPPPESPPTPTPAPTLGAAARTPVTGDGPSAEKVRAAQALVAKLPGEADRWVALGEAWVQRAREAQKERLYNRVEDAAAKALSLKPGHRGALRLQALAHRNAHRFEALQAVAQQLVDGDPDDPNGWALLGDAKLERGDYEGAAAAYQALSDRRPGIPAYTRVAWLRWLNGDVEGAEAMWAEAGRAAKQGAAETRAWIASEVGELLWHRGDLQRARAVLDAALKTKPDHAPSLFTRGRVRWAAGDLPGAIADLEASIAAKRAEPVYAWLAALQREAGDAAAAAETEALLAGGDGHDDPRSIALYLAHAKRDPERAVKLARQDVAARGDIFAHDALAFALLRAGDARAAAEHSAKALRLGTPQPTLWAHAGLIAIANGDTEAGRAQLKKALGWNPRFHPTLAAEARAALGPTAKLDPRTPNQFAQAWFTVLKNLKPDDRDVALRALETNWAGRRYRWSGLALAGLCVARERKCALTVWRQDAPGRAALGGTQPLVTFSEAGWGKLKTDCKGQDRCVVDFEATLSTLTAEYEKALRFEFSDGEVRATRAPRPDDGWFAKPAAPPGRPGKAAKIRTGKPTPVKLDQLVRRTF